MTSSSSRAGRPGDGGTSTTRSWRSIPGTTSCARMSNASCGNATPCSNSVLEASCAMRPAPHVVITVGRQAPPVLLLDDVFSELDPDRSDALLQHLPAGQAVLTSAAGLPPGAKPDKILHIDGGAIHD